MERIPTAMASEVSEVVHLVGRLTDAVFSFLGPATDALADSGVRQTVILIDDPAYRHLLPRFHPSIRLSITPAATGVVKQLMQSLSALCEEAQVRPVGAVHLHGFLPCLLGVYAARFRGLPPKLFYSPHGSKSLGPLKSAGALLLWALQPLSGQSRQRAIANIGADARTLESLTGEAVTLLESPVDDCFFTIERHEARRPLIVTGSRRRDPLAAALFAQMAVLLGEESLGLGFNWIGTADQESLARLKAADVGVFDVADSHDRAEKLAAGWLYVAPGSSLGFPVFLAEAMAVGLPCVAWDTAYHRDVVRHGETGFLCGSESELIEFSARLIDSPELRAQLGQAARAEAMRRFDPARFRDSVLAAYSLPAAQT